MTMIPVLKASGTKSQVTHLQGITGKVCLFKSALHSPEAAGPAAVQGLHLKYSRSGIERQHTYIYSVQGCTYAVDYSLKSVPAILQQRTLGPTCTKCFIAWILWCTAVVIYGPCNPDTSPDYTVRFSVATHTLTLTQAHEACEQGRRGAGE